MSKYLLLIEEQGIWSKVGESIVDGITSRIGSFFAWIGGKIATGIASMVIELTPVFVVVCIIGVFISMSGNRKLGTKVSSLSFMTYLLLRVIFK